MISPLGLSVEKSWQAILAGESGVCRISEFAVDDLSTQIGGTIKSFDATKYISSKEAKKFDNFILYGIAASDEAIKHAGLEITEKNAPTIGVAVGAGIGGLPNIVKNAISLENGGPRKVSPFFIPGAIINMLSGMISIQYRAQGPNMSVVTACTTGAHNIGLAARTIAYGDAEVMLAGGAEQACCRLGMSGFSSMRALSKRNDDPAAASRPWDRDRDGFVLSDGAGVLILEELDHAKKRGATIHAELVGFGASADAYHMTTPDSDGPARAMQAALRDANLNPEDIGYLNAHATSTSVGDSNELTAIQLVFGDVAEKLAISSTKSMTGHCLGAAGAIEAIFSIMALNQQVAPATINLDNPDLNIKFNLVPNNAQSCRMSAVMSNSFGFGGTNASLIFKKL